LLTVLLKGNYRLGAGTEVVLPKRIDDWSLTGRQQRLAFSVSEP